MKEFAVHLNNYPPELVAAAQSIVNAHGVERLRVKNGGELITAFVSEATVDGKKQRVFFDASSGDVDLASGPGGECSCSQGGNCEHVLAALMTAWQIPSAGQAVHEREQRGNNKEVSGSNSAIANTMANSPNSASRFDQSHLVYLFTCNEQHPKQALLHVYLAELEEQKLKLIKPFSWQTNLRKKIRPRFVSDFDIAVMEQLNQIMNGRVDNEGQVVIDAGFPQFLINQFVEANVLYVAQLNDQAKPIEPEKVTQVVSEQLCQLNWIMDEVGVQRLVLTDEQEQLLENRLFFPANPPISYPLGSGTIIPLNCSFELFMRFYWQQPWQVAPGEVEAFGQKHQKEFVEFGLPLPKCWKIKSTQHQNPTPLLVCYSQKVSRGLLHQENTPVYMDAAKVFFRYEDKVFACKHPNISIEEHDDFIGYIADPVKQLWLEYHRNFELEEQFLQQLTPLQPLQDIFDDEWVSEFPLTDLGLSSQTEWETFVLENLPGLKQQGWEIEFEDNFRYKLAKSDLWIAQIHEREGGNFSLNLSIEIDEESHPLLPIIQSAIRSHGSPDWWKETKVNDFSQILLPLPDGRRLVAPRKQLLKVIQTLLELFEEKGLNKKGELVLPKSQYYRLALLDTEPDSIAGQLWRWEGDVHLKEKAFEIAQYQEEKVVDIPKEVQAKLRSYQQQGVNWFQFLREFHLGGILADDMGLGKTLQCLTHLQIEHLQGRLSHSALVVVPTSLISNWKNEAAKFTPHLRIDTLYGAKRAEKYKQLDSADIWVTSYQIIVRDVVELAEHSFSYLIVDEAQALKNPRSKITQSIKAIKAQQKLCLTGTPMENHLGELWSLFDVAMPGFLGPEKQFKRLYQNPIERNQDEVRKQNLVQRVSPFMLRRLKEDVAKDLPPKTEIQQSIVMNDEQTAIYEAVRASVSDAIQKEIKEEGIANKQIQILDALLKLRQVCCDPRLLKHEGVHSNTRSAKLDFLMSMLSEMIEEGRRILVFSQFAQMLQLIEQACTEDNIKYVKLTGSTKDRAAVVESFQSGQVPLFLISLKAGGVGLNLTAADTVIHYDPWWNPAAENQATDRAYRIGQDKAVFVYRLIAEGTVEEKIRLLQEEKQALADALIGASVKKEGEAVINKKDLEFLFAPMSEEKK